MKGVKKTIMLFCVMLLVFTMSTQMVFASETETSGRIDSVLLLLEDGTVVSVSIDDYVTMFLFREGALYDFVSNEDGNFNVYGVVSGNKFILIDDYVFAYISDPNSALDEAEEIPYIEVQTFMKAYVDEETGEVQLIPIGEDGPVDKSDLAALIEEAEKLSEEDYTTESWQALVEALEEAIIVYENPEATQEEVDEALEALQLAIDELEEKTNEPYVKAVFIPTEAISFYGHVIVTPYNIPDAAFYTVKTSLSDGRDPDVSTIFIKFGQTKDLPRVFYNETVTVKVFNADKELLYTFENVPLK